MATSYPRPAGRTSWGAVFSLIVALLYGASPIDLIPDIIPIIGWMDDLVVVPLFVLIAFVQWRRSKRRLS